MHLELQSIALARFDAGQGRFPRSRYAAEGIVLGWIERINADADTHEADINELLGHLVIDQHAVGAEDDHDTTCHGMAGNVEDVRSHQPFAAGNDEEASLVDFRDLIDEAEAF